MMHYRMLPAVRVGTGALPPLPLMRRGMGDDSGVLQIPQQNITSFSSGIDTALQTMVSDIASNGCQQTDTPSVRAFQQAYSDFVTANGSTGITVDGLYGDETQTAANLVNATDQLNLSIPTSCVASASTSSGSTSAPSTGTTTSNPSASSSPIVNVSTGGSPYTPYLVAGAVVATGLVGYALWHRHAHPGRRTAHARPAHHTTAHHGHAHR